MADERTPLNSGYDATTPSPDEQPLLKILAEEIVHLRWRVLIFGCFITFGGYYIYDFPGSIGSGHHHSIEARFLDHGKEYTQEMNQALYSVYSWPNTILCFFGGVLIDNYLGLRRALLLFISLVTVGAAIFWVGILTVEYPVLVTGRVIYGFGNESLFVAQSAVVSRWFKGSRGLALAFGIAISFSRVGSSFNFFFSPMISERVNVQTAGLVGFLCCVFSLVSALALIALDVYGTKKGLVPPETKESSSGLKLSDITKLPLRFWIVSLICVSVYCSIFPFVAVARYFFEVKYNVSGEEAAKYVSVYQFSCAGASPVLGAIVDAAGRFTSWMVLCSCGFVLVHVLLLLTMTPAIVLMVSMGLFYSVLVASLWPTVPYIVDEGVVGLAFGIMCSMQNTGLATYPLIIGAILDKFTSDAHPPPPSVNGTATPTSLWEGLTMHNESTTPAPTKHSAPLPSLEGFRYTEILFIATAAFGIAMAVTLLLVDFRGDGLLGASSKRRREKKEEIARLRFLNNDSVDPDGERRDSV